MVIQSFWDKSADVISYKPLKAFAHNRSEGHPATGRQSFRHMILVFLGIGTITEDLKQEGNTETVENVRKHACKLWFTSSNHPARNPNRPSSFSNVHSFKHTSHITLCDVECPWCVIGSVCTAGGTTLGVRVGGFKPGIKKIRLIRQCRRDISCTARSCPEVRHGMYTLPYPAWIVFTF